MSKNCKKACKMLTAFVIAAALFLSMLTPAMAATAKKVPTLNATEKTILMGKTFDFNINNKIQGSSYAWTSNNKKVAVVDKNGIVTGVDKGSTTIYCVITTPKKITYRLKAKVTVLKPIVNLVINNKITHMNVDEVYNLNVTITPKTATDKVTWATSDKSIADPTSNGIIKAKKAGTVTITASSFSGKKDSVTIQVLGEGEAYVEAAKPVEETEKPKDKNTKATGTIIAEDFSKSTGSFEPRSATLTHVKGKGADGERGYLSVTGRTAEWNGASIDVTALVKEGKSYDVSGWVKYDSGNATEVFKITQEKNDSSWPQITEEVEVKKGVWTQLTGTLTVEPGTTKCEVYFEMSSSANGEFICDNFVIIDPTGEGAKLPTKNLPEGTIYKNDFEDGSILDSRASSERTNTKEQTHNGSASVEVKRTAAWDGAGVRFTIANGINKDDYYGKTAHVSMYVMYQEGASEVEFKINNLMGAADGSDNILTQVAVKKGEWTKIEGDALIADGTTGNLIFVETVDAPVTFYVDDVEISLVK